MSIYRERGLQGSKLRIVNGADKWPFELVSNVTENPATQTDPTDEEYLGRTIVEPGTDELPTLDWTYHPDTGGPEHILMKQLYKSKDPNDFEVEIKAAKIEHTNQASGGQDIGSIKIEGSLLTFDPEGSATLGTDANPKLPWFIRRKIVATESSTVHSWTIMEILSENTAKVHYNGPVATADSDPRTKVGDTVSTQGLSDTHDYVIHETGTDLMYTAFVIQTPGRTVDNTGRMTATGSAQITEDPVEYITFGKANNG